MRRSSWPCVLAGVVLASGCGASSDTSALDAGGPSISVDGGPATAPTDAGSIDAGFSSLDSGPADAAAPADAPLMLDGALRPDGGFGIMTACTLEEVSPIFQCGLDNCTMVTSASEIAACLLTNCGLLLLGVSPGCRECMLAGLTTDLGAITDSCVSGLPTP